MGAVSGRPAGISDSLPLNALLLGLALPEQENLTMTVSEKKILSSAWRAFFVYYVMAALCFFGPYLNPRFSQQLGLTPLRGIILGIILLFAVFYLKWGQEYQVTSEGIKKLRYFPARQEQLRWAEISRIEVRRGLTQSLLQIGNIVIQPRASGQPPIVFYGIENPKEVKELMERWRT